MPREATVMGAFRMTPEEKEEFDKEADALGMTFTDFMKTGARMLASFEPAFLEQVKKAADSIGIEPAIALQQLLLYYTAREAAILKVFGGKSATWARAFQVDESGMVRGSRLFDLVFAQTEQDALAFKKRLESWAKSKTKEPFFMSYEEAKTVAEARAARV